MTVRSAGASTEGRGASRRRSRMARRLDAENGDYYELLIALLESEAERLKIDRMRVITDAQLISEIDAAGKK